MQQLNRYLRLRADLASLMLHDTAINGASDHNVNFAYKFPNELNPTSEKYLVLTNSESTRRKGTPQYVEIREQLL